jgi:hypothetical protein
VDWFNPFDELKRDLQRGRCWSRTLGHILNFVFEQTSLAFEALLRRGFGEQYLSFGAIARVILVLFLLWIVWSWSRILDKSSLVQAAECIKTSFA